MFVIVDRNEKAFQNKYFMGFPVVSYIEENVARAIEVNTEAALVPMSTVIYSDDFTEEELKSWCAAVCGYEVNEIPVLYDYEEMSAQDMMNRLFKDGVVVYKLV